jgi:zinc transport system substrate-binding protein
MRKSVLMVLFTAYLLAQGVVAWAATPQGPKVVVSLKPLHSLVAGVMQGVGEPRLLIQGSGSPHGYVLRPSEARLLADAHLVVWVGHQLESFLEKPLSTLGTNARQLELAEELESVLLPVREGGSWDADHHEAADGHSEHLTEHGEHDSHFWLNPLLAKQMVEKTAAALAEIDPVHQQQYRENAARLKMRLDELHAQLKVKLAPVKHVPYLVFHDAYQYFEAAYGLNAAGSITIDPERKPGVRRVREIRGKIKELDVRCVFSEPQFESKLVATVIEGSGARTGVLDPLGAALPAGPESYFLLLNGLADNLVTGLREGGR